MYIRNIGKYLRLLCSQFVLLRTKTAHLAHLVLQTCKLAYVFSKIQFIVAHIIYSSQKIVNFYYLQIIIISRILFGLTSLWFRLEFRRLSCSYTSWRYTSTMLTKSYSKGNSKVLKLTRTQHVNHEYDFNRDVNY